MAESKKGHSFAIQGPTEKKIRVHLFFCTDATYKISSSKLKRFFSLQPTKGITERRTDRRTDGRAQTNMPPQLLRSRGHEKQINK